MKNVYDIREGKAGFEREGECVFGCPEDPELVDSLADVKPRVAARAQGYKILLNVRTRVASELEMMYFQIRPRTTELTAPAVATQYVLPKVLIFYWT